MVKFKALVRESGNSVVITIPRAYVDGGLIVQGREYMFDCVEEVTDGQRDHERT